MNTANPIRHVIVALAFAGIILVIAGDKWAGNITALRPVRLVQPGE